MRRQLSVTGLIALLCLASWASLAAPFAEGPKKCQECHENEYDVWKATQHAKSYKSVHKTDEARAIVDAVGDKSMKKSHKRA